MRSIDKPLLIVVPAFVVMTILSLMTDSPDARIARVIALAVSGVLLFVALRYIRRVGERQRAESADVQRRESETQMSNSHPGPDVRD